MKIDEVNALVRCTKRKNKVKLTASDHNLLIANFNISWKKREKKKVIETIYNFNDPDGKEKYKILTTTGNKLMVFDPKAL